MNKLVKIIMASTVFTIGSVVAGGSMDHTPKDSVISVTIDPQENVVQLAAANADFSTLVAAVKAADLADVLQSQGPFTIFAPTNEAFDKLPAGTVEDLLKPENKDKLIAILKYHVVPGKVMAADVKTMEAPTLEGKKLDIKVDGDIVTVNGAKVTKTDIEGSNGVIHVIDTVLIP